MDSTSLPISANGHLRRSEGEEMDRMCFSPTEDDDEWEEEGAKVADAAGVVLLGTMTLIISQGLSERAVRVL